VAALGAFVDIGVHQDGLVHVSAMSKTFVKDPRDVVKPGDVVRVKVLDVDIPRKRISLTLRLDDEATAEAGGGAPKRERGERGGRGERGERGGRGDRGGRPPQQRRGQPQGSAQAAPANSAMADALRKAGLLNPEGGGGKRRGR
jgi:uncharacterized protein